MALDRDRTEIGWLFSMKENTWAAETVSPWIGRYVSADRPETGETLVDSSGDRGDRRPDRETVSPRIGPLGHR